MYLDNVWRPNLSITGAGGIPHLTKAGNVVRAKTTVRASLRVSPDFDAEKAKETLQAKGYCNFDLKEFLDLFWMEPGLRRSIDKIYEIVVYALFSAIVEELEVSIEVNA
jgi:hypothetical protein